MIKRILAIGRLKEECIERYREAHDNISHELVNELKAAGIIRISCFLRGCELYVYNEYESDIHENLREGSMPHNEEFQRFMLELAVTDVRFEQPVEVFHLE